MSGAVRVRKVYDEVREDDGARVLVDRLWPRGVSKERADLTLWCKEVAPSTELRKWYHHEPARFEEFAERYRAELGHGDQADAFTTLKGLAGEGTLTLLTATKDPDHSEAEVLATLLRS